MKIGLTLATLFTLFTLPALAKPESSVTYTCTGHDEIYLLTVLRSGKLYVNEVPVAHVRGGYFYNNRHLTLRRSAQRGAIVILTGKGRSSRTECFFFTDGKIDLDSTDF